jgi:branched-chain amino acid transport system ATP-binding protein
MRGRVVLDGDDVTDRRASARARKGMCLLPEGRGIFPSLSVRENLILQSPKGTEPESIERAVAAFPELGNRMRQMAASLSGGEQQMLALVRTIVSQPKVVLIDEASLGLAPLVVDRVFDTVRRIAATGVSLLLVEQYVTRALELADWVYVLSRGQIVSSSAAKDLSAEDVFEQYLGIGIGADPAPGS